MTCVFPMTHLNVGGIKEYRISGWVSSELISFGLDRAKLAILRQI